MDVPAATETKSVSPPPIAAIAGSASPIICGFTAMRTIAGLSGRSPLIVTPVDVSQSDGFGSITQTDVAGNPSASQPSSIAEPILPQPTRTNPRRVSPELAILSLQSSLARRYGAPSPRAIRFQ